MLRCRSSIVFLALCVLGSGTAQSAQGDLTAMFAAMNAPQKPFRVFANTFYVGTHGLGAILVTSPDGHILIDGGLPESAPQIAENIRALGFKPEDVKLILSSHVHYDHAGGIAELQRLSGALVAASPWSAKVLEQGMVLRDDPQFGVAPPIAPVTQVLAISDGEVMRVGPLALTARFTPGHTPGGTSWTWRSCEAERCLNFVYADSLTAVSADGFLFSRSTEYPAALTDFEKSLTLLAGLPCEILLTPHPDASDTFGKLARRERDPYAFVEPAGCRRLVDGAREGLRKRLAAESSPPP
jgi:metallo-beta-lactamase class B